MTAVRRPGRSNAGSPRPIVALSTVPERRQVRLPQSTQPCLAHVEDSAWSCIDGAVRHWWS